MCGKGKGGKGGDNDDSGKGKGGDSGKQGKKDGDNNDSGKGKGDNNDGYGKATREAKEVTTMTWEIEREEETLEEWSGRVMCGKGKEGKGGDAQASQSPPSGAE